MSCCSISRGVLCYLLVSFVLFLVKCVKICDLLVNLFIFYAVWWSIIAYLMVDFLYLIILFHGPIPAIYCAVSRFISCSLSSNFTVQFL